MLSNRRTITMRLRRDVVMMLYCSRSQLIDRVEGRRHNYTQLHLGCDFLY